MAVGGNVTPPSMTAPRGAENAESSAIGILIATTVGIASHPSISKTNVTEATETTGDSAPADRTANEDEVDPTAAGSTSTATETVETTEARTRPRTTTAEAIVGSISEKAATATPAGGGGGHHRQSSGYLTSSTRSPQ